MSEDNLYLLFCYILYGLTLTALIYNSKQKLKTILLNLTIAAAYSGFFIYNLNFKSSGGTGLVWLTFLIFAIGIHWLINLVRLFTLFTKNKNHKKTYKSEKEFSDSIMEEYQSNTWDNYWKIFDTLIGKLKLDNQKTIISELKTAKRKVNGLTDGWFEFKFAFEKCIQLNRTKMTVEQTDIADLLVTTLNKTLTNRT